MREDVVGEDEAAGVEGGEVLFAEGGFVVGGEGEEDLDWEGAVCGAEHADGEEHGGEVGAAGYEDDSCAGCEGGGGVVVGAVEGGVGD